MLQGFFCPHWDVRPCFGSRNKNPTLGLTETHFLAAPCPAPAPQPPPCTIFMKTVEFLMKVNAVRVSLTGSGGVGREIRLFPKSSSQPLSWAQGMSHGHSRGRAQEGAKPPLPRDAKVWPGRVLSPQCWLGTHSPALPAAEGTASSERVQGALPCAFRDGIHYCDASKMPELL